jgi:hypothetical protein
MALVSSVNYETKRIYLHADTMDEDLDTVLVYKEVRALRRTTESHRQFKPIIVASGNVEKIAGLTYTAINVQLLYGCRLVPNDTADHKIRLVRDTFTDDGYAGRDCFDRSGLTHIIDIDVDFPEIEIREVATSGTVAPTASEMRAAVGLAVANLDTQLSKKLTQQQFLATKDL